MRGDIEKSAEREVLVEEEKIVKRDQVIQEYGFSLMFISEFCDWVCQQALFYEGCQGKVMNRIWNIQYMQISARQAFGIHCVSTVYSSE